MPGGNLRERVGEVGFRVHAVQFRGLQDPVLQDYEAYKETFAYIERLRTAQIRYRQDPLRRLRIFGQRDKLKANRSKGA
jgi:hypothetical protein